MRSGIVETIHYEQPNSRISAGDPLPSSRTAGSLREIHYLHASAFFYPCVFAPLRPCVYFFTTLGTRFR